MFCVARAERAIKRTRWSKSIDENRSAQNQFRTRHGDRHLDASTSLRRRSRTKIGQTPVSSSLPPRAARRRSNLSADQATRGQRAGRISGLAPTSLLIAPGKHDSWPKRSTKRPLRNDFIFILYLMRESHTRRIDSKSRQRFRPDVPDQSLENHRAGTIFRKGRPYVRITTIPLFYGLFGDVLPKIWR